MFDERIMKYRSKCLVSFHVVDFSLSKGDADKQEKENKAA
jgi:hypothetical protein